MRSTTLIRQVALALSVASVAQASWLDLGVFGRGGLDLDEWGVVRRQDSSSSAPPTSSSPPSSTSSTPSSTSSTTSSTSTTSTTSSTTSTTTSDAPTSTPPTSTASTPPVTSSSSSLPTSTSSTTTTSSPGETNGGHAPTTTSSSTTAQQSTTHTITSTYTSTLPGGSVTTGEAVQTTTEAAAQGDTNADNSEGMDQHTKNTIIGVCVGVGGAILLGVGALLWWRLRNKRSPHESEEPLSYGEGFGGPGAAEKTEPVSSAADGRSPFQSTLESYHAPTSTNAASNF